MCCPIEAHGNGAARSQLRYLSSGGPVIYRTDSEAGHFGTSLSQQAAQEADLYTFVEKALTGR